MKPDLLLCFLFFYDALSPMRTIHICTVMGPSTGTWETMGNSPKEN